MFVVVAFVVTTAVITGLLSLLRKAFTVHKSGIVLITGSSIGIGRSAAEHLAKNHSFLVLAGVRKEEDAAKIKAMNIPNLQPLIIDVSKHDSCVKAIETVKKTMKEHNLPFVCLINNAGINRHLPAEFQPVDDAKALFDTNVFGVLDLIQLTLPLLRESKGRIINLSSLSGFISVPTMAIYSASKFAVEGLSDGLRREVAHFGISVSIVQPGFVKTTIAQTTEEVSMDIVKDPATNSLMRSLYAKFYSADSSRKLAQLVKRADTTEVTSRAIEHALVDRYPKTRYPVSNSNGVPAWLLSWIAWLANDDINDFLVSKN